LFKQLPYNISFGRYGEGVAEFQQLPQDFIVKVGSFNPNGCKRILFGTPEFILKGPVVEPVGMVHGKYDGFTFGNIFNIFHFNFYFGKYMIIRTQNCMCHKFLAPGRRHKVNVIQKLYIDHGNSFLKPLQIKFENLAVLSG
jgi:hypothetical protein